MKRRGRPYNHTPECSERQAFFREQLRTSSVGDAPLAMELVAGLILPWPGMSETAGAPRSSSGVDVPQPMAVEPYPMVRRGLTRLRKAIRKSLKSVRGSLMST